MCAEAHDPTLVLAAGASKKQKSHKVTRRKDLDVREAALMSRMEFEILHTKPAKVAKEDWWDEAGGGVEGRQGALFTYRGA